MSRLSLPCLAALGLFAAAANAQQFTYNAAALPAQNIWTDGVEFADVDKDGDLDILFANGSTYGAGGAQPQHLFLNNGAGSFVAAHANLNVANFNAKMVIAEDFDNDGDSDLMYAPESAFPGPTTKPRLLINNGAGIFADMSVNLPNINMASFCVCAGDVDNDGDLDVVFTDGATFGGVATQARLYLNNGAAVFTDVTAAQMPADLYNAQDVTLFDFDGDADVDIALSGKGGATQARLYLNNGSGTFAVNTAMNGLGSGNTYEIDHSDLDGDGDMDALVQSSSGLSEGWARNDGPGIAMPEFTLPAPNGNDDNEMAGVDYDDDGDLDIFVASLASTEKAYRNNGNATFTSVTTAAIQAQSDSSLDFGFADLNGDCDYDMVTGQGESGNFTNKVYVNNGPATDTRAPVQMKNFVPGAIGASSTIFRTHLRDAVHDDGHISATTRWVSGTATAAGGGAYEAKSGRHMGGGLFRAAPATNASTTAVSTLWIARDSVGNATTFGPYQVGGVNGWLDLGGGKAGLKGRTPKLGGAGPLVGGSAGGLELVNARPSSTAVLFVSFSNGSIPLLGSTLVPFPVALTLSLPTSATGELSLPFTWPAGITPGTKVYLQYVVSDAAATFGAAFSNACEITAQ